MAPRKGKQQGVLITFEGIEGSGKTTQFARLAKLLRDEGYPVVETREPGGTPLAEGIRDIILGTSTEPMAPRCETLLILASRSQHVAQVVQPALRQGQVVLCDRFFDSTLAYQGYARGLDRPALWSMNRFATGGISPNLTLLLDVPVSVGLDRRDRHDKLRDRLDLEAARFHEKVRRGYRDLASKEPSRIRVIDGRPAPEIVQANVASVVLPFLAKRRKSPAVNSRTVGRRRRQKP